MGLLLALLECVFPGGTPDCPSMVAPTDPARPPVAFWYDDAAFHVGGKSYPWTALGTAPREGATFRIDLGQTLEHEPLVLQGRLKAEAPRLRIGGFGALGSGFVSNRTEAVVAKPQRLRTDLFMSGANPDYVSRMSTKGATAAAETLDWDFTVRGQMPTSGTFRFRVREDGGEYYYINRHGFHSPGVSFDLRHLWTERAEELLQVHFAGWTEADAACRLRVVARDYTSDTVESWSTEIALGAVWGERTESVSVKTLPPGFHWLHFDFLDRAGQVLHTDRRPYLRPAGKMPWEGTTVGAEDTVPPPWTRPGFAADGTFTCWNRRIRLGGAGLVSSVISGGEEVLTAPATFVADGLPLAFEVVSLERKTSEAVYRLKAREAAVEARVTCAFDGFVHIEATYPTTVKSLVWRVSASRRLVTGFDDCSSELNDRSLFRAGTNPGWTFDATEVQMWWMPGRSGLMGGIVNARGWHVKDLAKSGRVSSDKSSVTVETTLVDTPLAAGAPRTVSLYLEPTPVKPRSTALTSVDQSHIVNWTSHLYRYYETQYPGFLLPERAEPLRKRAAKGDRIFFYHGSNGVSPMSPFWNWFQKDWTAADRMGFYVQEAPIYDRNRWDRSNWTYGCLNDRSFLDYKIWSVNYDLTEGLPESKDVYFDLANPHTCSNPHHACTWTDDFGHVMHDSMLLACRELHLRTYRILKAKNPEGVMYGHISRKRSPSDVFFDVIVAGEQYAIGVYQNSRHPFSYTDVFTPERMQGFWLPRAQEFMFYCVTQLQRARQCYAPQLLASYDWKTPENRLAVRHMLAYIKIHDLFLYNQKVSHGEGPFPYILESKVRALGPLRRHEAYYTGGDTVTLSVPGPRQLWGYYVSPKGKILILLNDTETDVKQTVTVKGLSGMGRDILGDMPFDFSSGTCTLTLPPRGALFLAFPVEK